MQVESISNDLLMSSISAPSLLTTQTTDSSFGAMVSNGLDQVNKQLLTTQSDLQTLATGDVQNLHQIMIRIEESRLSFQLLLQVRNRLLESYQDIMKMQI